jgi:hypothetical protein
MAFKLSRDSRHEIKVDDVPLLHAPDDEQDHALKILWRL